jgi:murein DD-endopeptidase MepM/ murein hydrolase activator NlpD
VWFALWLAACDRIPDAAPVPTHTVARGETLGIIAKRYGVTVDDLVRWNQLAEPDRIEVGQVLVVWSSAVTPPAPAKKRARRSGATVTAPPGPAPAAPLSLPGEQPCRPPPELFAEEGAVASAGLAEAEVAGAMSAFVANTLRCVPEGWATDGALTVSVTVACTGRVASVAVVDPGPFPAEMVACTVDVLRYAGFPPHDQEGGFSFDYPLRFDFPDP